MILNLVVLKGSASYSVDHQASELCEFALRFHSNR